MNTCWIKVSYITIYTLLPVCNSTASQVRSPNFWAIERWPQKSTDKSSRFSKLANSEWNKPTRPMESRQHRTTAWGILAWSLVLTSWWQHYSRGNIADADTYLLARWDDSHQPLEDCEGGQTTHSHSVEEGPLAPSSLNFRLAQHSCEVRWSTTRNWPRLCKLWTTTCQDKNFFRTALYRNCIANIANGDLVSWFSDSVS